MVVEDFLRKEIKMSLKNMSKYLDQFEELGLSRNEASVYLALLENYPVTGYKLAKDSGILRPIVYEMLNRLVEKGGVKISKGSPEQYSPIGPDIFLKALATRFTQAQSLLLENLSDLNPSRDSDQFWNISSTDSIITSLINMISKAQESILLYLNDQKIADSLQEILSKKVSSNLHVICFSYKDISLPRVELYSYKNTSLPSEFAKDDIVLLVDKKKSIFANLATQKACLSSHPTQLFVLSEFIKMKIVLYRISQTIPKTQLSLYLFNEDKDFYRE